MTKSNLFFPYPDFLAATLAQADKTLLPKSIILKNKLKVVWMANGALYVLPDHSDSTYHFILSYGIHGNETAPIECCNKMISLLLSEQWKPAFPILFLFGNPMAAVQQERFIEVNLNRLFFVDKQNSPVQLDKTSSNSLEANRACLLKSYVMNFHHILRNNGATSPTTQWVHYDLHTAIRDSEFERFAVQPFACSTKVNNFLKSTLLESMGIEALLLQHKEASTFSSWTARQLSAISFTLELGQGHPFGENDLSKFQNVIDTLIKQISGEQQPKDDQESKSLLPRESLKIFQVCHEIIHVGKDFCLQVPEQAKNFTQYPKGTLIWEGGGQSYNVIHEHEYIVFPNSHVPQGQRAGLMIYRTDTNQHSTYL